ncbi:MAG: tetratricopeptide repeat protein, partial [Planctomycetota bacterium]
MAETDQEPVADSVPKGLLQKLRTWSGESRRRNLIIGVGFAVASFATIASWLTVAEIAVAPEGATVERALAALDDDDFDAARSIIAEVQQVENLTVADYGGALYVLGVLKTHDAEKQWSEDRSRSDYLIASRYLSESRALGLPEGRVADGLFLLGKSLIKSRQLEQGIEVLQDALAAGARGEARAHLMLAQAHFYAPQPDYKTTLSEVEAALGDASLDREGRSDALLLKSEALSALGRGAEAMESASQAGGIADPARRALAEGKALVSQLESAKPTQQRAIEAAANAALERARRADRLATSVTRESDYLRARIAELVGRRAEALQAYNELRRGVGASPAGITAAFAEGALHQAEGDDTAALESFRRGLDSIEDRKAYRNALMPLSEARLKVENAHQRFIATGKFGAALQLTDWVGRVLGSTTQIAMRAETLRAWGEAEIEKAARQGARGEKTLRRGRYHLREAGIAYERLAEARYATREFTDDLWKAAETLQQGQAYQEAIRVLDRYLRNEPVQRNALALLKIGEAQLAIGNEDRAIASLEECLEFHASDASSYRARLICANAYRDRGEFEKAEELLRHNLTRTALTPASPEWRDSKFQLGRLLAESNRNDEAIAELEEAVNRYPNDPQSRGARYHIALAHRQAAREPLDRLRNAQTVNDREVARRDADKHLRAAHEEFESIRREITIADSIDTLDRATLRNCFMLGGDVLFELGRYEEARQSFASVSTLYQNEPYMLEALVQIYHCWRRQGDQLKAYGVIDQAKQLLDRLPPEADFANS